MSLLLSILTVGGSILCQNEIPKETLDKIEVLPVHWLSVAQDSPEQAAVLRDLIAMPREQRDRLLDQDDPHARGMGIYVTAQQGDWKRLLAIKDLLADQRQTIPAIALRDQGGYVPVPQTVEQYLAKTYLLWFGVTCGDLEGFDESKVASIRDPDLLVNPWIVRLQVARESGLLIRSKEERESSVVSHI